ncbi:hypothetical protein IFT48_02915 [Pseudomonas fluorescens]|uniref:hypothetical protein n=1 Tax=Pseudomonas TaxID=286 RepID=UPI000F041573|nr:MULTISPECIES: hypothetical protein [Pseudomonas]MBD8088918.1 hypothetical protein [Pseudomonas fluorescens]MBD8615647.1 hypothetical protein [Pseudomonas putida]MBD8681697.1 hypothetical protein [Pseudomonas sp. CFBP 13719]
MTDHKAQIQQAIQASIDVLSSAKAGPEKEWLVLDTEQAQSAIAAIDQAVQSTGELSRNTKTTQGLQTFAAMAYGILVYTESTISILDNGTSESHQGRTVTALEQLKRVLSIIDEAFAVN